MIVLVEDDADQRLALKLALQAAGYAVRVAANGHEALSLVQSRPPAYLITDIFMPEADGFELIQKVRERSPTTKIIVVSGGGQRARIDYLEAARLMGVEATLQKPFEVETLLETLKALASAD